MRITVTGEISGSVTDARAQTMINLLTATPRRYVDFYVHSASALMEGRNTFITCNRSRERHYEVGGEP